MSENKMEISYIVDSTWVDQLDRETIDEIVRSAMSTKIANEIAVSIPTVVTRRFSCSPMKNKGIPFEVHKMTLFIFSEQDMREHDEGLCRQVQFDWVSRRALQSLSGEVQH